MVDLGPELARLAEGDAPAQRSRDFR
jgi:hypothetical protein